MSELVKKWYRTVKISDELVGDARAFETAKEIIVNQFDSELFQAYGLTRVGDFTFHKLPEDEYLPDTFGMKRWVVVAKYVGTVIPEGIAWA